MTMLNFSKTFLIFLLLSQVIQGDNFWQNGNSRIENDMEEKTISFQFDCLPEDYKLTDVVSYGQRRKGSDERITIRDKLIEMKARCKGGKLVDASGKEIRFFKFTCFGNPPIDYDEIMRKEREALDKLQKNFTVIILECDPRIS